MRIRDHHLGSRSWEERAGKSRGRSGGPGRGHPISFPNSWRRAVRSGGACLFGLLSTIGCAIGQPAQPPAGIVETEQGPAMQLQLLPEAPGSDTLGLTITWKNVKVPALLLVSFHEETPDPTRPRPLDSEEDLLPGPILVRGIKTSDGRDSVRVVRSQLSLMFLAQELVVDAFLVDGIEGTTMQGDRYVRDGLRPAGTFALRPQDAEDRFVFLRREDACLTFPDLYQADDVVLEGPLDSMGYEVESPGSSTQATGSLLISSVVPPRGGDRVPDQEE